MYECPQGATKATIKKYTDETCMETPEESQCQDNEICDCADDYPDGKTLSISSDSKCEQTSTYIPLKEDQCIKLNEDLSLKSTFDQKLEFFSGAGCDTSVIFITSL